MGWSTNWPRNENSLVSSFTARWILPKSFVAAFFPKSEIQNYYSTVLKKSSMRLAGWCAVWVSLTHPSTLRFACPSEEGAHCSAQWTVKAWRRRRCSPLWTTMIYCRTGSLCACLHQAHSSTQLINQNHFHEWWKAQWPQRLQKANKPQWTIATPGRAITGHCF